MKNILLKIKAGYESKIKNSVDDESMGLCYTAFMSLTINENTKFKKYFKKYLRDSKQTVFFDCYGEKTKDKNQFTWIPRDTQSRLNWLDEQIAKN